MIEYRKFETAAPRLAETLTAIGENGLEAFQLVGADSINVRLAGVVWIHALRRTP